MMRFQKILINNEYNIAFNSLITETYSECDEISKMDLNLWMFDWVLNAPLDWLPLTHSYPGCQRQGLLYTLIACGTRTLRPL